jgi:hypothetical protein
VRLKIAEKLNIYIAIFDNSMSTLQHPWHIKGARLQVEFSLEFTSFT